MKRGIIVLLFLLLIGAAVVGGWWWARESPVQATQFLVDCGLEANRAQEFIALIGGEEEAEKDDVLLASGSIEGEEVSIVTEFGGLIVGIYADQGDAVASGQVLVKLDESVLRAQLAQAEAGVEVAEANVATVQAGTHPAEIMAARAILHQTIAERAAARIGWEDLQAILDNPQEIEAQLIEAQTSVELAAAQIKQAEAELALAIVEQDQYRARGTLEEKKLYAIYGYRVVAAQAALDGVKENLAGARKTVAALEALLANPLALVSEVHRAEAQYNIATAGVGVAAARLDELMAGASPEAVAVAEAQVSQARASAALLQAQIEKMTLRSPVDGVLTGCSVHAGEAAVSGMTLCTVAVLDEVTLMLYIPEDELNRVYLGQGVEVQVDSFPGRAFEGAISYVSQEAEFTPRNVQTHEARVNMVFAVKVRLPNLEHLLKPGMPADAAIGH